MKKLYVILAALLVSGLAQAQVSWKKFTNKTSKTIGTYQGFTYRESGFSSLYYIKGTDMEFFTISDRGPNIDAGSATCNGGKNLEKIFPFPNYVPKIHRIKLAGDSIQILKTIPVKRPGTPDSGALGIPNPPGAGGGQEVAWYDTTADCAHPKLVGTDPWGIDPEGILIGADNTFWICEEYGTTMSHLDSNGKIMTRYSPYGGGPNQIGIDTVIRYRTPNRGMEGIAIAPVSKKIYGFVQSTMQFPNAAVTDTTRILRFVELDPVTNATREFVYVNNGATTVGSDKLKPKDWKIGDMAAINDSTFLVIEHAVKGGNNNKKIYLININGATPITSNWVGGKTIEQYYDSAGLASIGIVPIKKTVFLDLMANGWDPAMDKPEDLAIVNDSTIVVGQDNDYGATSAGADGIIAATNIPPTMYIYTLSGANKIPNLLANPYTWSTPVTGIGETKPAVQQQLGMYPNPVKSGAVLFFTEALNAQVLDMTGRVMAQLDNAHQLSTTGFAAGIYIVRDINGSVGRFVVE